MKLLILAFLFLSQIALAKNEALLQEIERRAIESDSDSLVIIEKGQTVVSRFFHGADAVHSVQSVTKSVCALAIGLLLEDHKIASLDEPLSRWFPAWAADPQKSQVTLRMILNHTSGLPDVGTVPGFWEQPDAVATAANTPLEAPPGSRFLYSSIGATLLEQVIEQSSRMHPREFVKERLFGPLGIEDFFWNQDKAGHEGTSGGLFLSTADLVKIGQLMLSEGAWQGRQLLQPSTVHLLVQKSQPYFAYGLLFWLNSAPGAEEFSAVGWGGQYITVNSAKQLIVVRTKDPASVDQSRLQEQNFHDLRELMLRWE